MKHIEKKYRVDSLTKIGHRLKKLGAKPTKTSTSMHYYGQPQNTGVVKLVIHKNRCAIHILDEQNGKFSLRKNIPVNDKAAGLQWLKQNGYNEVGVIKMEHTDYDYKDGVVGLYTLNDTVCSVILDFPNNIHEQIEQELEINNSQAINQPYDKLLEHLGYLKQQRTDKQFPPKMRHPYTFR